MIRNSVKLTTLGAVALLGGAIGLNCSKGSSGDQGDLKIAFQVPGGQTIDSVHYAITKTSDSSSLTQGDFNVSDPNATISLDVALPPTATGQTDTVVLTAMTTGGVSCSTAPTTFTVTSGANTDVMLAMICGTSVPQTVPGTVDITTVVSSSNSCPSITSAVVAPAQTSVGATAAVSATGADPDSDPLTYGWAPAANFAGPALASTTYTCTTAGLQPITLSISDGKCNAQVTLQINCVGATGAGGAAGAATGGTAGGSGGAAGAATGGTAGGTGGAAGAGTGGAAGAATGGTAGAGTGGTAGAGGPVASAACDQCEFNNSAPPVSYCSGTVLNGGATTTLAAFGCEGLTNPTDIANCEALAYCLRGSACQAQIQSADSSFGETGSAFDDPKPCLCGPGTLAACLGLSDTTFAGACAHAYRVAAGCASDTDCSAGVPILNHLADFASPIGLAGSLMTCDVDSANPDNGLTSCGTVCGLNTANPQ
ncbi:MAG TPA: hypothetical protein VMT03_00270 [Polyangia bacterium]|nr:hypothetical protein [Polyangia bacterium]